MYQFPTNTFFDTPEEELVESVLHRLNEIQSFGTGAVEIKRMKLLPQEAINAVTINGAYEMEVNDTLGSITKGKKANVIITKPIPSLVFIPYSFGGDHVERAIVS